VLFWQGGSFVLTCAEFFFHINRVGHRRLPAFRRAERCTMNLPIRKVAIRAALFAMSILPPAVSSTHSRSVPLPSRKAENFKRKACCGEGCDAPGISGLTPQRPWLNAPVRAPCVCVDGCQCTPSCGRGERECVAKIEGNLI
jgi:hypothetical protein